MRDPNRRGKGIDHAAFEATRSKRSPAGREHAQARLGVGTRERLAPDRLRRPVSSIRPLAWPVRSVARGRPHPGCDAPECRLSRSFLLSPIARPVLCASCSTFHTSLRASVHLAEVKELARSFTAGSRNPLARLQLQLLESDSSPCAPSRAQVGHSQPLCRTSSR